MPEQVVSLPASRDARRIGLRYVTDAQPGIRRVRAGRRFRYLDDSGQPVADEDTLARIRALAVPPAWEEVWICASAAGHLQATGRDQRGRKQYRYHADWRKVRDTAKFDRMVAFGEALPRIRARVEADLRKRGLPREKVLATIVRLLDTTAIRVGNQEYARSNHSYGLTTLRDQHVDVSPSHVVFAFRGKSGKRHRIDIRDARLARIVRQCRDLPGYELFQYLDEDGERHSVGSQDVNDYLREIAGSEFTAKDFRTWHGTVMGAVALRKAGVASSKTAAARRVTSAIEHVAGVLGNTVAVCRKSYVHPAVVEAYLEGMTIPHSSSRARRLDAEERATLSFLRGLSRPRRPARQSA